MLEGRRAVGPAYLVTRAETLRKISGLSVSYFDHLGNHYFVFSDGDRTIKTVCTYRKAKAYAEGVLAGRRLGQEHVHDNPENP